MATAIPLTRVCSGNCFTRGWGPKLSQEERGEGGLEMYVLANEKPMHLHTRMARRDGGELVYSYGLKAGAARLFGSSSLAGSGGMERPVSGWCWAFDRV